LSIYQESDAFDELQKRVLDYAVALTTTPDSVDDDLVDELRRHLNEKQLVELTTMIAWENFRARFNRGFDVAAQGFSDGASCPVPERRD
jgi:alkylhydroperoxidase family enzyme